MNTIGNVTPPMHDDCPDCQKKQIVKIEIGTVYTVEGEAEAHLTLVDDTYKLSLGIPKGEPGEPGEKGDSTVGPIGPKGKSVFEEWLEYNPDGTWEDFMDSIKGPGGSVISEQRIFKLTATNNPPATPTPENYLENGWTAGLQSISALYPYLWISTRTLVNGVGGNFSTPVLYSMYVQGSDGDPGTPGENGADTVLRFAKNGSPTNPPSIDVNAVIPEGWTLNPPSISTTEYIWVTKAQIKNGVLMGQWSPPVRFSGLHGTSGNAIVYVTVYKRSASQPETPTGGSFSSPVPEGWYNYFPSGSEPIWASNRIFTQDGQPPQQENWSTPQRISGEDADAVINQYMLSNVNEDPGFPTNYDDPPSPPGYWVKYDSDIENPEDYVWIAYRQVDKNGFPLTNWTKWRNNTAGDTFDPDLLPKPNLTSFVFLRSNTTPATPTGGSYASPIPTSSPQWSDTIVPGEQKLWMTYRLFTEDGNPPQWPAWKTPVEIANSSTMQVKFSHAEGAPGTPSTAPNNWHDPGDDSEHDEETYDKWIAIRTVENGVASGWNVTPLNADGNNAGPQGDPGPAGPFILFRGDWDPYETYYGNTDRIEVVRYGVPGVTTKYYITRTDAGGAIPNDPVVYPTNTTYWNEFGEQFQSVATGLLLSEMAVIKNLCANFIRTGPAVPNQPGSEHLEIYPSLSTLEEFADQEVEGYAGLDQEDLENLANTLIFYDITDTGDRSKESVEANYLMKLKASQYNKYEFFDFVIANISDVIGTDGETLPSGSSIEQKINYTYESSFFEGEVTEVYKSDLRAGYLYFNAIHYAYIEPERLNVDFLLGCGGLQWVIKRETGEDTNEYWVQNRIELNRDGLFFKNFSSEDVLDSQCQFGWWTRVNHFSYNVQTGDLASTIRPGVKVIIDPITPPHPVYNIEFDYGGVYYIWNKSSQAVNLDFGPSRTFKPKSGSAVSTYSLPAGSTIAFIAFTTTEYVEI